MSAWENYHLEWSADPLSVTIPTWQDISPYALAAFGAPISITGGVPTIGSVAQPTVVSVSLDNHDHRFTFGNTSSPLSPNWKPGRRIRCYETIAGRRFDEFTGYIQPPETNDWAEQGIDQYMTLIAVDRLGWLQKARAFISTLAEYILFNGGTSLAGFWPLTDPTGSHTAAQFAPGGLGPLTVESGPTIISPTNPDPNILVFSGATPPAGDDANYVRFNPVLNSTSSAVISSNRLTNRNLGAISMAAGTNPYVTIAGWINADATNTNSYQILLLHDNASTNTLQITFAGSGAVNCWLAASNAGGATNVNAVTPLWGTWQYYSARINNATGALDLWIDNRAYTGTTGGASSGTMDVLVVDNGSINQGVGQVQIYLGAGYTQATHMAQYRAGVLGLAGQYTGQRISTLMQYAGVPASDLGLVSQGTALLQKAAIAGRDPFTAMQEAQTTEQGRLRTNGQGLPVFDARTRRYNS